MQDCKTIGCAGKVIHGRTGDFCQPCVLSGKETTEAERGSAPASEKPLSLAQLYPKYFKDVSELDELDVYMTHQLFQIDDHSGAIQHASKKLLLSGVRTGGKSKFDDIREARDTLNRWLQINDPHSALAQVKA